MDFGLIIDWLGNEGGDVLRWWLWITLAGAVVWPLLYHMLSGLPDRGYTLARAAGLMLTGFMFWFLGSMGVLRNEPGGIVLAWVIVACVAGAVALRPTQGDSLSLRAWWREHRALVITTEVLFLLLLFGWAAIRAHNPEMRSTEKPMELMFINSIRASDTFPPQDAWLGGYAISYYYFGYVIVAGLAELSGVTTGVAFNLAIATIFALTGIGALGVVYNMVRNAQGRRARSNPKAATGPAWGIGAGILALVMLTIMGSLGTALVELPYEGYAPALASSAYFDFWDIEGRSGGQTVQTEEGEVTMPPDADGDGIPDWDDEKLDFDRWSFTYGVGWRYSRAIHDRQLDGTPQTIQPIAEFPQFSFLLSDIHPHVLALPFAVLAVGLALNLVLKQRDPEWWELPLYAIWVGGMIFMNSWDAVYIPLLIGAEALRRLVRNATGVLDVDDLWGIARFGLIVFGLTLAFYLPWIISFTSQAGGVLPNVVYPTAWQQYFLQFGVFIVVLGLYLSVEIRRAGTRFNAGAGLLVSGLVALLLILMTVVLGITSWNRHDVRYPVFSVNEAAQGMNALLRDILGARLPGLPSELLLLLFIFVIVGRLFARPPQGSIVEMPLEDRLEGPDRTLRARAINFAPATGFALLLIGAATVLTLAPDFVYLRDNFAVRINTVFKLYYQGWILFSLASGFAVWSLLADREPGEAVIERVVFGIVIALFVIMGLAYPVLAGRGRMLVDTDRLRLTAQIEACKDGGGLTCGELPPLMLDGTPQMVSADEYAAVQCLSSLVDGSAENTLLAEAPGGAYEPHKSRFSALTGIPTLIGWQNHERQWRGPTYPKVTDLRVEDGVRRDRISDVQDLYTTLEWDRAWQVIDRYGVDFVVVGEAERQMIRDLANGNETQLRDFEQGLDKFDMVLQPVCQSGATVVYRVGVE